MPITIQCPVSGVWKLFTPAGHHPYSKDFVALDFRLHEFSLANRLRYCIASLGSDALPGWDQAVVAPMGGKILRVEQDHDDRVTMNILRDTVQQKIIAPRKGSDDMGYYLGNYIIMEADSGHHFLFAHLRKGSARVFEGQTASAGDTIAHIGNSGVSMRPHLHFHITHPEAEHPDQPVPFVFDHYQSCDNGVWHDQKQLLPVDNKPFRTREA